MKDWTSAQFERFCAMQNYIIVAKANKVMDEELAATSNKRGILMKYLNTIPPLCMQADPYDFEVQDKDAAAWWASGIAIGELMLERIKAFASVNSIELPGNA
jgi:hypothetical protein